MTIAPSSNQTADENAGTVTFLPHQLDALYSKSKFLVLTGGAGSGKSFVALEKCIACASIYHDATIVIVRKTRESLVSSVGIQLENILERDPNVVHQKSKNRFYFKKTGSYIILAGLKDDRQRSALLSIGKKGSVDLIWVEEATQLSGDDLKLLLSRLRGKAMGFRQLMVTTNPGSPQHYIYRYIIANDKVRDKTVIHSRADMNPHIPEDYVEWLRSQDPSSTFYKRYWLGEWVAAEGAVYPQWTPDIHICDPFEIPEWWIVMRAVDYGFRSPASVLWAAINPLSGDIYIFQELYQTELTANDLAPLINHHTKHEITSTVTDRDPAANQILNENGIPTDEPDKDKLGNIDRVKKYLDNAIKRHRDGNLKPYEHPALYVFNNSLIAEDEKLVAKKHPLRLADEMLAYEWEPPKEGKETIADKPKDEYDHAEDALGYLLAHIEAGGLVGFGAMDILDDIWD